MFFPFENRVCFSITETSQLRSYILVQTRNKLKSFSGKREAMASAPPCKLIRLYDTCLVYFSVKWKEMSKNLHSTI